jgi:integrase
VFEIDRPGGEETPRARALDADEILTIWQALDRPDGHETTVKAMKSLKLALKLLLVTAQRRGELMQAKREEFDLEREAWLIPAEHSKNGYAHAVPLTPLAVDLVKELFELAGDSKYLVPSPRANEEHDLPMTERALTRLVGNNREAFAIPHWTPHDLRRTATTLMKRTTGEAWDRVLNHLPPKLHRTYDVHDPWAYFDQKKAALQAWDERLQAILAGREAKVLPMAR